MKIKNSIKISILIRKFITGKLSKNEEVELSKWVNESEHNRYLFNKYKTEYFITTTNLKEDKIEAERAYERFINKNKQHHKMRLFATISVAASLLLLICGSLFLIDNSRDDFNTDINKIALKSDNQNIKKETAEVLLINDKGEKIALKNRSLTISKNLVKVDHQSTLANATINKKVTKYNTLKILKGDKFKLKLEDGTTVWINADSEIRFPNSFDGKKREVTVKGELFFDVAHNDKQPFIVNTPRGQIKVLGTAFNVHYYKDEKPATTLVRGKIEYKVDQMTVTLTPGEQCSIENNKLVVRKVNTQKYIAWIDEKIVFDNQSLEYIFNTLSRNYNMKVNFENDALKKVKFSGGFKMYQEIDTIIKMLEKAGNIKVIREGDQLIIK